MEGNLGTSDKVADERDESVLAVEFVNSGESVSFKLADGGLVGWFVPREAAAPDELENGDGAGMGPGNGVRAASPGTAAPEFNAAPELGSAGGVCGSESESVGRFDCKPVEDGKSGNELSLKLEPAFSPELDRPELELGERTTADSLLRDELGPGSGLADAADVKDGGIAAGMGIKEFDDSSFGAELPPPEREDELEPGNGRYWSGGGSARAPFRF
ncbi:MAG: hypothetical protein ACK5YR_12415 [Pirellula sp.]